MLTNYITHYSTQFVYTNVHCTALDLNDVHKNRTCIHAHLHEQRTLSPNPVRLFACVLCTNLHWTRLCILGSVCVCFLFGYVSQCFVCYSYYLKSKHIWQTQVPSIHNMITGCECVCSITNKPMHTKNKHIHLSFTPFFPFSLVNLSPLVVPYFASFLGVQFTLKCICCMRAHTPSSWSTSETDTYISWKAKVFFRRAAVRLSCLPILYWSTKYNAKQTPSFIQIHLYIFYALRRRLLVLLFQLCVCKPVCLHDISIFCTGQNKAKA